MPTNPPRILLGAPARLSLVLTCSLASGAAHTIAEVVRRLHARLPAGYAITYDIDAFSIMFLDADREIDSGEAIAAALAEMHQQGLPHRVMRTVSDAAGRNRGGAHALLIASSPDVLAFAAVEFKARCPGVVWH